MSSLRAVSLCGVRSFGCEEADRQRVGFSRPLTLILGENGCGKTTLLEALKFALCDELPPNADHGRSFVHDPTLHRNRETRAQIRLEFTDSNNSRYLVIRSMQAQLKQKKMQFQRLDHCVQTYNENGEIVEISGRCGDTNNTITSILGVSKAILNNVIFCHQEDSNWPLDEGKKLKERFDAIFDATKYNKCFEYIKKMRKQYAIDIKLLDQEVKFCSEKKTEFEYKKQKQSGYEEKISDAQEKLRQIQTTLEPIYKRLNEIESIERNYVKFKSEQEMTKAGLKNCIKQQTELKNIIKVIYTGSEDMLQSEIESFLVNLSKREASLNNAYENLEKHKKHEIGINKKISVNDMKKSELFTLEGQNQEKTSMRNEQLLRVAKFAEISTPDAIEEDSDADLLTESVQNNLHNLQTKLKESMADADVEEKQLQKDVDNCRDILTRHSETILSRKKEFNNTDNQAKKLETDISKANKSKSKLESMKEQMDSCDINFQDISKEFNVVECETVIKDEESQINKLESNMDDLDKTINVLQIQNTKITEIGIQNDALMSKQKDFKRIKNKNKDAMVELIGNNIPDQKFKIVFKECQNNLKSEVDNFNKQLKIKQHEIATLEAGRVHQKNELDQKKKDLSQGEEELYKYCKTSSLENALIKIDTDINKFQDQKLELSSSEFVIKRFIDKLKDESPCCPLCHRGFEAQRDVSELIDELQDKIRNVPKNLESVLDRLSKLVSERDQLISLRPLSVKVKQLKNEDISLLEKKLEKTDMDIQMARDNVEELMMSMVDPEDKLAKVESLLPDMPLLDQLGQEISSIKSEIGKLELQLGSTDLDMTLEEANSKQSDMKQKISRLRLSVKSNQTKLKKHEERLNIAREKKNRAKEEYLQAQAMVQELCSLQTRYDEIMETKTKLQLEIDSLTESSASFKNDLLNAEQKKKKTITDTRANIDKQRKRVNELDKMFNTILGFNKEIDDHKSKNIFEELKLLKDVLENLHKEKNEVTVKIKSETDNIDQIKHDISNQKINKRDLEDNLNLKKCEKEQVNLEEQIKKFEEKMGQLNHRALTTEKEKLLRSENTSMLSKASTEGEIKQLQESVKQTKMELMQTQYKNINEKYRKKFYELQLLKSAEKDIKDYAFAMDCCLMKYHKDKMKKINSSIRDMWRNIYRGNDIDYIEIKTDESTSNTASGNRRVYDYRVVQHRNDVEIDMRGRCSAGQKVLASLIIRMALAESFSNRFGVLALDEPTTNLDRENIASLCSALKDMVMSRMKQNNFMFIIITHDTEFLTSLGSIDKLTHYYRVTRNQEGKSRISKERMP